MSDEQIIQGCLKNDLRAQKQLYDRFASRMMGVCLRYSSSYDEAKDMLQDGFIKVFNNIRSYRFEGELAGWIKKVMVNNALEEIRRRKITFESLEDDVADIDADQVDIRHEVNDLLRTLQQLPKGYRTIFNLFAIEGYTHVEIAEKLGITEGTSKSQYARAKMYLQKILVAEKI